MTSSPSSKLWLARSVVAAFAGALVAALVEVRGEVGRFPIAVAAIAPLALPLLLVLGVTARAVYAAWLPATLLAELREERGGMPRLAAWVGVVWLGLLGLAWAMFQGIWLLASWTAFKASSITFLAPGLAIAAVLVLVALSRPAAELFTIAARWLDARWRRFGPGSLLRPPVIFGGAAVTACLAGYLIWVLLVSRRLPELSAGFLAGPLAGVLATALVHAAWRGPRRARAIAGGAIVLAGVVLGGLGVVALGRDPEAAMTLWSESRLARLGLERVTDLEDLRDALPIDRHRPIARSGSHRDLVLITIDGARADRMPGHDGAAPMPALADLASRGSVFPWAFAPSTTERRAIPSLVTGLAPQRLRGQASEHGLVLDPRHVGFAERLRAAGYQTAAFTCCFTDQRTWLRGFEHRAGERDPARLVELARGWLATRPTDRPVLVWIHLAVPWPEDREAIPATERRARYDAGLATVDRALASALDAVAARTPIVIVAGTRGEELGEHGAAFTTDELYNTQLHVPLVIAGPTVRAARLTDPVSIVDLGPTLIELAGFAPPPRLGADGLSLAPLATGLKGSTGSFAFAAIVPDHGAGLTAMTAIRGTLKLIDSGGTIELYDLHADPGERVNLASARPQQVAELRALLTARVRAGQQSPF